MFKRTISYLLILIFLVEGQSFATGIPVVDFAGLAEQITHYGLMLQQYSTQAQQYSTQLQQLQYQYNQLETDYLNLNNLNFRSNLHGLADMQRIMNSAVGISHDASRMQTQFEALYPDFAQYHAQNGTSYARQAAQWGQQNQQSALDTLRVQAAIQQNLAEDGNTLATLNSRSDNAAGMKDLLQIANQLLIMQTKQLMQLEQLLASTAKADSAYIAERASKEAAAAARDQKMIQQWNTRGNRHVNPNLDRLH